MYRILNQAYIITTGLGQIFQTCFEPQHKLQEQEILEENVCKLKEMNILNKEMFFDAEERRKERIIGITTNDLRHNNENGWNRDLRIWYKFK